MASKAYKEQIKRQKEEAKRARKAEKAERKRTAEIERLNKRTALFNAQARERRARLARKVSGRVSSDKPKHRKKRKSGRISLKRGWI